MIAPSLYQHQRLEHRRGRGSPSLAAVCDAQVPAAHDKAQDGLTQVPGRFLPVRTGGGLNRSRLFSQFKRCAPVSLAVMRLRRQANVAPPSVRLVATKFMCRPLTSAGNSDAFIPQLADHSPCRVTDLPPVVQFRRLSSLVASDVKHRDREGFRNVRTPFQGARNDF